MVVDPLVFKAVPFLYGARLRPTLILSSFERVRTSVDATSLCIQGGVFHEWGKVPFYFSYSLI
jgi:hypothetical protein